MAAGRIPAVMARRNPPTPKAGRGSESGKGPAAPSGAERATAKGAMAEGATTAEGEGASPGGLRRELNLFGAVSMIVGIVIGSGIFLGVNRVAAGAGSPSLIALAWVLGGALTLMGALTYAELGAMFPRAGGAYVFIRESLGRLPAFLLGWTAFTVNLAGSAAALAVIFAEQLNSFKPLGWGALWPGHPEWTVKLTAACLILVVAIINWFGIRLGGNVQKGFTVVKGSLMVFLAVAALIWMGTAATPTPDFLDSPGFSTYVVGEACAADIHTCPVATHQGFDPGLFFGLAMVAVLFAYDGWTNVATVGSEIKDPARNLPRAMALGVSSVVLLYLLVSFGYLHVLGFQGFADGAIAGLSDNPKLVASNTAFQVFGVGGRDLVTGIILVSVLGSLNGITISGPRFYYAMARDGLFPATFGRVNRHHVPGHSIWVQAGLAIVFLLFLDFNELTDNVVFVSLFFYALAAIGLLVLRRKRPDLPRPYKVPLYPWVPLLYIVASLTFVGYLLWQALTDFANVYRIAGLLIVALGLPVYYYFQRRGRVAQE